MSAGAEHGGEAEFRGTSRFVVEQRIGEGAVGVVYRARDLEKNTEVALKTLRRTDALALYRFKQEFRALADVSHPNLAGLYELMSKGDQWFFTMELVDGVDFLTYVRPERTMIRGAILEAATIQDRALFTTERELEEDARTERAPAQSEVVSGRSRSPFSGALDPERLENALVQLAHGVMALHEAGKLHRDIKPTNVLVTEDDRVVLLDFGLVTEVDPGSATELGGRRNICGTAGYMSPEQSAAQALTPASDWYSVGVMLYEALTGQLPFTGTVEGVLREKQRTDPPRPSTLVPGVNPRLEQLAMRLLRRVPEQRARGHDILEAFGATTGPVFPLDDTSSGQVSITSPSPARQPFVGREKPLAALNDAFEAARRGRPTVMIVSGHSGVGKSALIKRFTDELVEENLAIVLSGRCYERESVPYKALDNLVDALCDQLIQRRDPTLVEMGPGEAQAIARLFPVLTRIRSIDKAAKSSHRTSDPRETRRRAFSALKRMLARLAAKQPLLLAIDDLQWGDADSAALLIEILRPPHAPPMLLILSHRPEGEASPVLAELRESLQSRSRGGAGPEVRELVLDALNEREARSLALELLAADVPGGDEDVEGLAIFERHAASIARESGGSPFFVSELVRFAQAESDAESTRSKEITLEEVLLSRIHRLAGPARLLLELVAIAGRPLELEVAARAARLAENDKLTLPMLRAAHLVRVRGARGQDLVETFHDRIRETVHGALSKDVLAANHRRLAQALEETGTQDMESLAIHWQGAGEPERAARYFAEAAEHAADMLAFERSARLYRQSIALEPAADRVRELFALLGDALANAGRGAESAHSYLNASRGAAPEHQLERRRRAAEQLLRSGHVDEGLTVTREVLSAVGMRLAKTPRRALAALAIQRARLATRGLVFRERAADDISPEEITRIDICWSVALGLGMVDVIRSTEFQSRHLLLALEAGEPYRISRALSGEALMLATRGARGRAKTEELLARAEEIGSRIDHPHALGMAAMARGMAANLVGHWKHGRRLLELALGVFRDRCTGVSWETATSEHMAIWALAYLGHIGELQDRVPVLLDEAKGRGDLYFATHLSTGLPSLAWLARDDVDGARRVLAEGIGHWSQQGFHLQHYNAMLAEAHIELYAGDGPTALRRIERAWPELESSLLLRVQQIHVEALHLGARAHLACASLSGTEERARHLGTAERIARQIESEGVAWATPLARLLRAGVLAGRGEEQEAAKLYEDATLNFEAADMELFAAAARRRKGELEGGHRGRAMVEASETFMEGQRIRCPERFADMLAPVVRVRETRPRSR